MDRASSGQEVLRAGKDAKLLPFDGLDKPSSMRPRSSPGVAPYRPAIPSEPPPEPPLPPSEPPLPPPARGPQLQRSSWTRKPADARLPGRKQAAQQAKEPHGPPLSSQPSPQPLEIHNEAQAGREKPAESQDEQNQREYSLEKQAALIQQGKGVHFTKNDGLWHPELQALLEKARTPALQTPPAASNAQPQEDAAFEKATVDTVPGNDNQASSIEAEAHHKQSRLSPPQARDSQLDHARQSAQENQRAEHQAWNGAKGFGAATPGHGDKMSPSQQAAPAEKLDPVEQKAPGKATAKDRLPQLFLYVCLIDQASCVASVLMPFI